MKIIKKIEKCKYCDGKGYTYREKEYDDGYWYYGYYETCSYCYEGKYAGNHSEKLSEVRKGSGKVENTYSEVVCSECNGDKKVRYIKPEYNGPQYSLFGNVSYEEQKAWENKRTEIKNCQTCKGTGKELLYESSKPYNGGCFLTTACVDYYNLEDDCYELETLRNFRDIYIRNIPNGNLYIKEYYEISPKIVQYIQLHPKKDKIFNYIYACINKSIFYIENKNYSKAFEEYQRMYHTLLELSSVAPNE